VADLWPLFSRALTYPRRVRIGDLWPALLLGLAFATPWIVAILWSWRRRPRDGAIPPSLGEMVRKRLWTL
jgi:hypothetical protein